MYQQENYDKLIKYCGKLKNTKGINNKILFTKPPQLKIDIFNLEKAKQRGYYAYPPTGLQYIASSLDGRGLDIDILDINYEFLRRVNFDNSFDYENWLSILDEYFKKNNPSIVGVSSMFQLENQNFVSILKYLKSREKKLVVIAGGQNATYGGRPLLEQGLCDFICEREGENKINYLFDNLFDSKNSKKTSGILFKYNGEVISTGDEKDLVLLGGRGSLIKEHQKIPIENYYKVGTLGPFSKMAGKDKPFATLIFNRGCMYNCRFCSVRDYMGKGIRSRDVKDTLEEINFLYHEKGIRHFEWLDDDFTRYGEKVIEIINGMKMGGIKDITWAAQNGLVASTLSEELLSKMRDSNCLGFKVGIESGNQEMLRLIRKPGNIKTFKSFSERIQKFPELFISLNYIIGFPNETFGQIMNTFNFSKELNSDWSAFSIYQHTINYFGEREKHEKKEIEGEYQPAKDSKDMKIITSSNTLEGLDIFNLPLLDSSSREQLKQIWFTFNLIRNFIQNKNLRTIEEPTKARPDKFVKWLSALQETYPSAPYISFFLSLAHQLTGDSEKSGEYLEITKKHFDSYWKTKFDQFRLTEILNNFPENSRDTEDALYNLRRRYLAYK